MGEGAEGVGVGGVGGMGVGGGGRSNDGGGWFSSNLLEQILKESSLPMRMSSALLSAGRVL